MAVRTPLYMTTPLGETSGPQIFPYDAAYDTALEELAGHAYALNPNPRIEIGGSNGSLVTGQPFVDTWWSPGAGTTDVTNFDSAAETPNIFKVTDNYNNIRVVYDSVSLPADTNNTAFPLYLYDTDGTGDNVGLRCMTLQDFIDSFVLPVLGQFAGGGQTLAKSGTYYMTTSSSPANATVVGLAARNQQENPAAYLASEIPEDPASNNIITNYYIAKVNFASTSSALYDDPIYDLPLYFDSGTESIRHHSPTTWAALLNPFLRYYLGGNSASHTISYNVDGSTGVQNGTAYVDTGITTAGSTYQTRYVNTNDYRTQEFPTGTPVQQGLPKIFKIHQGA